MKRLIIVIVISLLIAQLCIGQGSSISKLEYFPKEVKADDSIKIKYHYFFSSQPCRKDSFNTLIKDSIVTINVYFTVGTAASPSAGNDSISLSKLSPRKYRVLVKINRNNKYSCSDSILLMVDKASEVKDLSNSKLMIYTNPAMNIIYYNGLDKQSNIKIFDCLGKMKKTIQTSNEKGEIDVSDFGNGIFLIRIEQKHQTRNYKISLFK